MNAYTTTGQARMHPRDVSALLRAHGLAGASLAGLEWQRGCQAEAEVTRRLKHNGVTPRASGAIVSVLRQTIGVGLVRTGERLAGVPRGGVAPDPVPAVDTLGMAS